MDSDPIPAQEASPTSPYLAAVDLGSNSFHMLIARVVDGEPVVIDRLREPVRLAWGLDEKRRLSAEARERALAALERFGQRIRHIPPHRVRAVGTNTLRKARKGERFLEEAQRALGHTIDVISGREEARLIYLGVAHSQADDLEPRLVVDIGGGSTELILGERFEAFETHSLHMGCIAFTKRFFPEGKIRRRGMEEAVLTARAELQTIERRFRDFGWGRAVGASGTVRATAEVLRANGWARDGITPVGLQKLDKALRSAGQVSRLSLEGLKPERARVFPGGVAILIALFEALGIERMEVAAGALREGLTYDLLGRIRHEDVRERTIRIVQERYHVDGRQAARVERNALAFLKQAAPGWGLDRVDAGRFLTWAARLHEIGLTVSYAHHHRHGAYLIANSDLPGFSQRDHALLAAIVGGHRRKVDPDLLETVPAEQREGAKRLLALLRLAVLTNRERGPHPVPPVRLEGRPDGLALYGAEAWLERHPLTVLDLEQEAAYLKRIDFALTFEEAERA